MSQNSNTIGLIELPESDYHAHPAISKSGLDRIAISPAHFKAWKDRPDDPTDAMIFGSLCHRQILEPESFESTVVCAPDVDRRTKEGKATWEDFQASNAGKTVLKRDQYDLISGMAASWRSHPLYNKVHDLSRFEASAFWTDAGVHCKARPDIIHPNGMILDLKTTDSALPADFQRTISKFRYHVQAAWYLDGVSKATGQTFDQFCFIAIEKKPPFAIAVYVATPAMIEAGRKAYLRDFETYAVCRSRDIWPSYPTEVQPIDLPLWAIA